MLGDLGEGLRKQDLSPASMLSENGSNCMTGYLNKSYAERGSLENCK